MNDEFTLGMWVRGRRTASLEPVRFASIFTRIRCNAPITLYRYGRGARGRKAIGITALVIVLTPRPLSLVVFFILWVETWVGMFMFAIPQRTLRGNRGKTASGNVPQNSPPALPKTGPWGGKIILHHIEFMI